MIIEVCGYGEESKGWAWIGKMCKIALLLI